MDWGTSTLAPVSFINVQGHSCLLVSIGNPCQFIYFWYSPGCAAGRLADWPGVRAPAANEASAYFAAATVISRMLKANHIYPGSYGESTICMLPRLVPGRIQESTSSPPAPRATSLLFLPDYVASSMFILSARILLPGLRPLLPSER